MRERPRRLASGPCKAGLPMDDDALKDAKARLRRATLAQRDSLDPMVRIERSLGLVDAMHQCEPLTDLARDGRVIAGFHPIRSEIDPRPLMVALADMGAVLALPAVVSETVIEFRELVRTVPLEAGPFATRQPPASAMVLRPAAILAPLAAFDANGGRLGYGGGFYDRAIARSEADGARPFVLGVAFEAQRVHCVPVGMHDRPLDGVLTERGFQAPVDRSREM